MRSPRGSNGVAAPLKSTNPEIARSRSPGGSMKRWARIEVTRQRDAKLEGGCRRSRMSQRTMRPQVRELRHPTAAGSDLGR
ncbi:hypothetical protein CRG98_002575 [Punica granatum]|uniref:Uncharacterized protein n=1 Tax=Punica granatum TaxID=22663 RepID=A0A2I0L8Q1_PUNGR|nr:hypothetical protein CRG98_002575 [Punica granatum]